MNKTQLTEHLTAACLQTRPQSSSGETEMGKHRWNYLPFIHKICGNQCKHTEWKFFMNVDVQFSVIIVIKVVHPIEVLCQNMGDHHRRPQHSHTCTYKHAYTHYRVGVSMSINKRGKNEMIFTGTGMHDDKRLSIYLWMKSKHLESQTNQTYEGINARVTLPYFIYIQNTLSLWCWYSDNSPPHTLTRNHPLTTVIHTHTIFLKNTHPLLRCWWLRNCHNPFCIDAATV